MTPRKSHSPFPVLCSLFILLVAAPAAGSTHTSQRRVHACLPLPDGSLAVGSRGGLTLLDARGKTQQQWTRAQGLPGTQVLSLLARGPRLWVGTDRGVARMDREASTLRRGLSIAGPAVRGMSVFDGALYLATWDGLRRLRPGRQQLQPVPAGGRLRLTSVMAWQGKLYAGSAGRGLWVLRRGKLRPHPASARLPATMVWTLAADPATGRLLVGTLGGAVSLDRAGTVRTLSRADSRVLHVGARGALLGSYGRGLLRLTATGEGQRSGAARPPVGLRFVNTVSRAHGVTCVGTRAGLWVQRGRGALARAPLVQGPPSNDVAALAMDRTRLWVGTFDQGLASLHDGRWQRSKLLPPSARINTIAVQRKPSGVTLWVGTARGLYRVQGSHTRRYGLGDGLRHLEIHTVITLRGGGVLVGTGRGAVLINGQRVEPLGLKQGLPVASIWTAAEAADGSYWLGTSRGLYHWIPTQQRYRRYSVASGHLKEDFITALAVHQGAVFAGTYNSGVTRLQPKADKWVPTHLGGGWVNLNGLSVHDNILHAATMGGLRLRSLADGGAWRTEHHAAPGRDVTAVVFGQGQRWVASRRGLMGSAKSKKVKSEKEPRQGTPPKEPRKEPHPKEPHPG